MEDVGLLPGLLYFLLLSVLAVPIILGTRRHRETLRFQIKLFLIAFTLRFSVSLLLYAAGLTAVIGDEDSSGWSMGLALQQDWARHALSIFDLPSELTKAFYGHHQGYGFMLAAVFYVTGLAGRLPAAALNGFFGALTVVLAYRIARTLFSDGVARRVGWWTCIFPSMIIWSAQTVKEPVVIMLETLALYGCVRLRDSGISIKHMVLCSAAIVLLIPFRFYGCYIVSAAVLVSMLAPGLGGPRAWMSAVALVALLIPVVVGSGLFAIHEAAIETFDIDTVQKFRVNVSQGGKAQGAGSGIKTADIRTSTGMASGLAVGAAHLLLAPFPWELGSSRSILTIPEVVVWWVMFFVGVVPGFWYCIRKRFRDICVLLLFIVGFGLLYSLMFGNVGLVVRQRAQLLPWLFVFAAVGIEQRKNRRMARAIARRPYRPAIETAPQPQPISS